MVRVIDRAKDLSQDWPVCVAGLGAPRGLRRSDQLALSVAYLFSGALSESLFRQRTGKAQLITVWVADMEVALPPRCVRRRSHRTEPGRKSASVYCVHVVDPKHDPTPDASSARAGCVELKVEVAETDPEACEARFVPPVEQTEAKGFVEGHRFDHVDGQKRHRADALDRLPLR